MSLNEVWEAAAGSPFTPAISKDSQLPIGFTLLLAAVVLTVLFGLNRSFISLPLYGIPASLAFAFGVVYTICGVGVYV
jgi:cell cycle checkpoint protein